MGNGPICLGDIGLSEVIGAARTCAGFGTPKSRGDYLSTVTYSEKAQNRRYVFSRARAF